MNEEHWHLSKEIPIALMLSIVMTAGAGVWYASNTDARITVLEKTNEQNAGLRDDIVTLKEQIRSIDRLLTRVENILDRRAGQMGDTERRVMEGSQQ